MNNSELASFLRTAVSGLHKSLRKQARSVVEYSMTEVETISHLFHSSQLLPTELAELTKVKTQSMSQILNKLEYQGFIKRLPSKEDRRKVYISLTSYGLKMVEKVRYDKDEWLKGAIEKSLTQREKQILEKALPVLNKLIKNN